MTKLLAWEVILLVWAMPGHTESCKLLIQHTANHYGTAMFLHKFRFWQHSRVTVQVKRANGGWIWENIRHDVLRYFRPVSKLQPWDHCCLPALALLAKQQLDVKPQNRCNLRTEYVMKYLVQESCCTVCTIQYSHLITEAGVLRAHPHERYIIILLGTSANFTAALIKS